MDESFLIFRDEAAELLTAAEEALLALEDAPADPAPMQALFRAVHTIKGSAGLFGLEHIVALTHVWENLLDKARHGETETDVELIELSLACRDQLETLVNLAVAQGGDAAGDEAAQAALIGLLDARLSGGAAVADDNGGSETITADPAATDAAPAVAAAAAGQTRWHLSLALGPMMLEDGFDPLSLLGHLERLGTITRVRTFTDALPRFADLQPTRLQLQFEVGFESDQAGEEAILDVFEFVLDQSDIDVFAANDAAAARARADALADRFPELPAWYACCGLFDGEMAVTAAVADASDSSPDVAATEPRAGEAGAAAMAGSGDGAGAPAAGAAGGETLRISAQGLESLINLLGELVIAGAHNETVADEQQSPEVKEAAQNLMRLVNEVRDCALGLRMVPIGETFNRFKRIVRRIGKDLHKEIEFSIEGGETELDKTIVEKIVDPLTHLVRNALDHGIEPPAERIAAGKPAAGRLQLRAFHDSGAIVIEIVDDGRGLDADRILARAIERGVVPVDAQLSEQDIYKLIFEAGFSTAAQVTNLSGRGVGLDVVRKNIEALRGQVRIDSTLGRGTTFRLQLPLTLAIINGFQVRAGDDIYVIPLELVTECSHNLPTRAQGRSDIDCIELRGEALPYVRLTEWFGAGPSGGKEAVVVVRFGATRLGLVVDALLGEAQTVIKPLGALFENLAGISGATILGDGTVALIIDVPGLLQQYERLGPRALGRHTAAVDD